MAALLVGENAHVRPVHSAFSPPRVLPLNKIAHFSVDTILEILTDVMFQISGS
jgi:hypothetical protein